MLPSDWAGLLLSLLQDRGQKLDVPMPTVPLSVTPTFLVTLGRIRKQEASQPQSCAHGALPAQGALGRGCAGRHGTVSLGTAGLSSLISGPSPKELTC